jgi:hypothetical protein
MAAQETEYQYWVRQAKSKRTAEASHTAETHRHAEAQDKWFEWVSNYYAASSDAAAHNYSPNSTTHLNKVVNGQKRPLSAEESRERAAMDRDLWAGYQPAYSLAQQQQDMSRPGRGMYPQPWMNPRYQDQMFRAGDRRNTALGHQAKDFIAPSSTFGEVFPHAPVASASIGSSMGVEREVARNGREDAISIHFILLTVVAVHV